MSETDDQLKDLQALFRVPVHLKPIATGGSYLVYDTALPEDDGDPVIGFVPDGSSGGFYIECCCSGITADPNGKYCNGICYCGACDGCTKDNWEPGHTCEFCENPANRHEDDMWLCCKHFDELGYDDDPYDFEDEEE